MYQRSWVRPGQLATFRYVGWHLFTPDGIRVLHMDRGIHFRSSPLESRARRDRLTDERLVYPLSSAPQPPTQCFLARNFSKSFIYWVSREGRLRSDMAVELYLFPTTDNSPHCRPSDKLAAGRRPAHNLRRPVDAVVTFACLAATNRVPSRPELS